MQGDSADFGTITDATLLVRPDVAARQRGTDLAEQAAKQQPAAGTSSPATGATAGTSSLAAQPANTPGVEQDAPPAPAKKTRFYSRAVLSPEQYSKIANKITMEIAPHLLAEGAEVEISIEIHAKYAAGYSEAKIRTITENARTLKLDSFEFEEE